MLNKKIIAALALAAMPFGGAFADELTAAKKADLRTFVELNGAKNLPAVMADSQTRAFAREIQRVKAQFPEKGYKIMFDQMSAVLNEKAALPDGLYDQLANVYHNHLTHDELKEVLRFQQSAVGKKLAELQPKVGKESMEAAAKWASQFAPEIDKRVKEGLTKENIKFPEPPKQGAAPSGAPKQAAPAKTAPAQAAPAQTNKATPPPPSNAQQISPFAPK